MVNTNRPPAARENWLPRTAQGIAVWTPDDWQQVQSPGLDLLLVGPEEAYRANLSVAQQPLPAPTTLDLVVQATAAAQRESLKSMLEYERRPFGLAGRNAVQREYAWFEEPLGLVLYQVQVLAILGGAPAPAGSAPGGSAQGGTLVQIHATSAAPSYFRYAAMLRRMLESITIDRPA